VTIEQAKTSTCLWFHTEAQAAAEFYISLIPGSRIIGTSFYGENAPMPDGTPLLVRFELAGTAYSALNGGPHFSHSCAASIVVNCDDQAEIDRIWQAILDRGGTEQHCGWIIDPWGLSWQVVPAEMTRWMESGDPSRIARMMAACLTMTKLDHAALSTAFEG
jgi:predicted 3-demethylubiquinone-9 3-methyltransferase (glyoxalase superfamily)